MRRYITIFFLLFAGTNFAFAETLAHQKPHQSAISILLGLVVISGILFVLLRRQKRRFND